MPHYYNDMYDYDYPPPGFNEDEGEQDYEYPELTPSECDRWLLRNVPSCSSIEDTNSEDEEAGAVTCEPVPVSARLPPLALLIQ